MAKATLHIALKSGNEFEIECGEGTGDRPAQDLCEEFHESAGLADLVTLRIGPHIFYCREIERISFSSPADRS